MNFNTNKWMKNQYLTEAGLQESTSDQAARAIDKAVDSVDNSMSPGDFAKAVALVLKGNDEDIIGFGSQNFKVFMDVLHAELGMKESLNEVESSNIERIDFSFVDGTTKFYGAYIYNKGSKRWDEKLSSSEKVQDFLTSLGIDIEFDYYNLPEIFKALKAQGIEAEDSEFDVS